MRFGFVTCVQLGLSCMDAIYRAGGSLDLAVSLPDDRAVKKAGRVYLDEFCARHDIPLLKSPNVNEPEIVESVRSYGIDWLFIIGWSQIAREEVLAAPRYGVLGMHPTLLPTGRGRAAIPWAILKRLDRTGVTLFKLDSGVDTGDIIDQLVIPLGPTTDAAELYAAVEKAHIQLIASAYPKLVTGILSPRPQDHSKATEWPGRKPEDGEIDLTGSVFDAECLVRAVTRPYPGAFYRKDGRKIIIWRAELVPSGSEGIGECLTFPDGALRLIDWEYADE